MKCPHCLVEFTPVRMSNYLGNDIDTHWQVNYYTCPNPKCGKYIIYLVCGSHGADRYGTPNKVSKIEVRKLCYPKGISRSPLAKEVPTKYADDYHEACLVLSDSSKASAALSRRCLQFILREEAKVTHTNLHDEIEEVISKQSFPSELADSLHSVREIGNFAAHPIKSTSTGLIVEVEPGEAEWNLEVLEELFDYYFVRPARIKAKKDALDKKLKDGGKKGLKGYKP